MSVKRSAATLLMLLAGAAASVFASPARADCPGFPQCCASTCDPSCCYQASGFSDPNGCSFGAFGDSCIYSSACDDPCGTCNIPCLNMKVDAGAPTDAGVDSGSQDAGAPDAGDPDAGDAGADLPPLTAANVCYVFIHGSQPAIAGPSHRTRPDKYYWGNAGSDPDDPTMYQGNFIRSVLTGTNPPTRFAINPVSGPKADGTRWATVSWEGTQPYFWAALDVLQQLDTIENEGVPTSLYSAPGDAPGDETSTRHQGINHCRKNDYLVLIGHSMGNLVTDFLLENSDPSDLNYEFLRTGGLTANAPFYVPATGHHILYNTDPAAKGFNHNEPFTNTTVQWTVPKSQAPGSPTVTPPTNCPGGVCPPKCFYPSSASALFPDLAGVCLGDPMTGTRSPKAILSKVAYHYSLAGPLAGNPLADCSCFYNLPGDASNLCKHGHKLVDAILEILDDSQGLPGLIAASIDSVAPGRGNDFIAFLHKKSTDFGSCNGAAHSMMSAGPELLRNLGGQPSRVVYLFAGTDPYLGGDLVDVGGLFEFTKGGRPVDCFMGGVHANCIAPAASTILHGLIVAVQNSNAAQQVKDALTKLQVAGLDDIGGGGPTDYPPPLNDQAVPIASAMACNVDQWSPDAKMSPTVGAAANFARGLCNNSERIWLSAARSDTVFASQHGQLTYGVDKRGAYATPESFWTHVRNPIKASRRYYPGEALTFGKVGSIEPAAQPFFACFHRPPVGQFLTSVCGADDPDPRMRFMGCEPECVPVDNEVVLFRDNRTLGHIIGIEERYLERRNRAW